MILNNADNIMIGDTTIDRVCIGDEIVWDGVYRKVEFIKSTGTQRIDTDIVVSYSMKTQLDAKFGNQVNTNSETTGILGVSQNDQSNAPLSRYTGSFEPGTSGNYDYFAYYIGYAWSVSMTQDHVITDVDYTNKNIITYQRDTCSFGSKSCTLTIPVQLQNPTEGITIFGVNYGTLKRTFGLRDIYCYGIKIYDGNILKHKLIPVERKSDGELGLFDAMTGKFYTNSGTGSFEKGAYVSS